jgi:UDP-N-acetylmuramoyl-L-alanyl-D-glutamate--2,6-diaminopimelate ligase
MRLGDIAPEAQGATADIDVKRIAFDSRKVERGDVFFAIPGAKADGAKFISDALARGATAIVGEASASSQIDAPFIVVSDARAALSAAAARFYPRQPAMIAAVTGTSGKTSVAAFLRQIWLSCGRSAASLGTVGLVSPTGETYSSLTTPDPLTLHETLDRIARQGVTHLAMEASSHGLDQRRLDGVRLSVCAYTNLSRDHLDYHSDMEDYFRAKLRLFETLAPSSASAVVEADDPYSARLIAACQARGLDVVTVGSAGRTLRLIDRQPDGFSTRLTLEFEGRRRDIRLPLAGAFQTSNALVAAGMALAAGEHADKVFAAVETLQGAPGRLDYVGARNGGAGFVDYAHKPAALENALAALRPFARGKLICVFGCGGDRDRGKRPIMGEISARLADITIVTDDNPRSETAQDIRNEVLAGARNVPGADVREIGDRAAAILAGARLLETGDVLLVAGKGHEQGQIVGDIVLPFSDHAILRAALEDA